MPLDSFLFHLSLFIFDLLYVLQMLMTLVLLIYELAAFIFPALSMSNRGPERLRNLPKGSQCESETPDFSPGCATVNRIWACFGGCGEDGGEVH